MEKQTKSIIVFKNEKKEAGSKQPDYTGKLTLADGTEQDISLWIKEGKNGKFMAGNFKDPFVKSERTEVNNQAPASTDLPF